MREIFLSDGPNHIKENFINELEVFSIYPEEAASRDQGRLLMKNEYERWKLQGTKNYEPTRLSATLMKSYRKTAARRFISGIVTIVMCALQKAGERVSLESASKFVEEFNNSNDKLMFTFWDGKGLLVEQCCRVLSDRKKIQQAFREYRSVSHIHAAWVTASEVLDFAHPFDRGEEADRCHLHTVLDFQHRISKFQNFETWDLWQVRVTPPFNFEDFPPFLPSDKLLKWLTRPWLESQRR